MTYEITNPSGFTYASDFPAFRNLVRGLRQMPIKTKDELTKERERLAAELARVEEKLESRDRFGEDPFKNGDMLKIMITFPSGSGSYTYAAVKARGRYFLSGRIQRTDVFGTDQVAGWTYDKLVSWLASADDARVWRVKHMERVF